MVTNCSKLKSSVGSRSRFANIATKSVTLTSKPNERVPSNSESVNIINPLNKTIEVYIILTPVSSTAKITALLMFQFRRVSSCLYLAKKCIVSSIEIPNAIENTRMVEGLIAIPVQPIIPAVNKRGIMLGISAINTILTDLNRSAITSAINRIAREMLIDRFFTR